MYRNSPCNAAPCLLKQIGLTPRYRQNGLWPDTGDLIIFADATKAEEACLKIMESCPHLNIMGVCLHKGHVNKLALANGVSLPIIASKDIINYPQCLIVLYWSQSIAPDLLHHLETDINQNTSIAIFPRIPYGPGRKKDAAIYENHGAELEAIYTNLLDNESRLCFASVVKGLLTGEIDWIRPAGFSEYQHPVVKAVAGDIVLDGGLFDSTVLRQFALACGLYGHVYGFEPEPDNFIFVQSTLAKFGDPGNVTLVDKGLYEECAEMNITAQGSSGMIVDLASVNTNICETVTIDRFVEENELERVDLIKMDIEGSEIPALKGASATISRFRPKLQICAYHNIHDLYVIPQLITAICPYYRFYFASHAPYLNEYVYYGIVKTELI